MHSKTITVFLFLILNLQLSFGQPFGPGSTNVAPGTINEPNLAWGGNNPNFWTWINPTQTLNVRSFSQSGNMVTIEWLHSYLGGATGDMSWIIALAEVNGSFQSASLAFATTNVPPGSHPFYYSYTFNVPLGTTRVRLEKTSYWPGGFFGTVLWPPETHVGATNPINVAPFTLNEPPTATIDSVSNGPYHTGTNLSISYQGDDSDDNLTQLVLQQQVDSGPWTTINDQSFTSRANNTLNTSITLGTPNSTYRFRVQSYDEQGESSPWVEHPSTITVINRDTVITAIPPTVIYDDNGPHIVQIFYNDADNDITEIQTEWRKRDSNTSTWSTWSTWNRIIQSFPPKGSHSQLFNTNQLIGQPPGTQLQVRARSIQISSITNWTAPLATLTVENRRPRANILRVNNTENLLPSGTVSVDIWGQDDDNNLDRLDLERRVNNGPWEFAYSYNPPNNRDTILRDLADYTVVGNIGDTNQLRLRAVDTLGLVSDWVESQVITITGAPPTASIDSVVTGSFHANNTVTINYSGADSDGNLSRLVLQQQINGGTWNTIDDRTFTATANNSLSFDITTGSPGTEHNLRLQAQDEDGNISQWVELSSPIVVLNRKPKARLVLSRTENLRPGTGFGVDKFGSDIDADLVGLELEYRYNGGPWQFSNRHIPPGNSTYTTLHDYQYISAIGNVGDTYQVRLRSFDSLNETSDWVESEVVTISAVPPTTSITVLENGDPHRGDSWTINYTGNDANSDLTLIMLQERRDSGPWRTEATYSIPNTGSIHSHLSSSHSYRFNSIPGTQIQFRSVAVDSYNNRAYAESTSYTVSKQNQSINFPPIPDRTVSNNPLATNAISTSGLPVSISVISGNAFVKDQDVYTPHAGNITLRATQNGNDEYDPAIPVERTFSVNKNSTTSIIANPRNSTPDSIDQIVQISGSLLSDIGLPDDGTLSISISQGATQVGSLMESSIESLTIIKNQRKNIFDSIDNSMGTWLIDQNDVSSLVEIDNQLGRTYVRMQVYVSSATYVLNHFEYTKQDKDQGCYTPISNHEVNDGMGWRAGWNTIHFPLRGYRNEALTPWNNMDRLKLYRTGPSSSANSNQFIIVGNLQFIKYPNGISPNGSFNIPWTQPGGTLSGIYQISVNFSNSNNFADASANAQLNIQTIPQSINASPIIDKIYGDDNFNLSATASSGLPITYSVSSGNIVINNNEVTIIGAGPATILANQSGNITYAPAPPVSISFNILKRPITLTLDNQQKYKNQLDPAFTYTITGFENDRILINAPKLDFNSNNSYMQSQNDPSNIAGNFLRSSQNSILGTVIESSSYNFSTTATGNHEVWVYAKAPSGLRNSFYMAIGQTPTVRHFPIRTNFDWVRLWTQNLGAPSNHSLNIAPREPLTDIGFIMLQPPEAGTPTSMNLPSISLSRSPGENTGSYNITASVPIHPNYSFIINDATLQIINRQPTARIRFVDNIGSETIGSYTGGQLNTAPFSPVNPVLFRPEGQDPDNNLTVLRLEVFAPSAAVSYFDQVTNTAPTANLISDFYVHIEQGDGDYTLRVTATDDESISTVTNYTLSVEKATLSLAIQNVERFYQEPPYDSNSAGVTIAVSGATESATLNNMTDLDDRLPKNWKEPAASYVNIVGPNGHIEEATLLPTPRHVYYQGGAIYKTVQLGKTYTLGFWAKTLDGQQRQINPTLTTHINSNPTRKTHTINGEWKWVTVTKAYNQEFTSGLRAFLTQTMSGQDFYVTGVVLIEHDDSGNNPINNLITTSADFDSRPGDYPITLKNLSNTTDPFIQNLKANYKISANTANLHIINRAPSTTVSRAVPSEPNYHPKLDEFVFTGDTLHFDIQGTDPDDNLDLIEWRYRFTRQNDQSTSWTEISNDSNNPSGALAQSLNNTLQITIPPDDAGKGSIEIQARAVDALGDESGGWTTQFSINVSHNPTFPTFYYARTEPEPEYSDFRTYKESDISFTINTPRR